MVAFREANDGIRSRAQQLGFAEDETVFFFCECDDPRCTRVVAIVLGSYEDATQEGRRIMSSEHDEPSG